MVPLVALAALFLPYHSVSVPAPPAPIPVVASIPTRSQPRDIVATTTTTTLPPEGGYVEQGPSITTSETSCLATWIETETSPTTGEVTTTQRSFGADCPEAEAVAAEHPGATVTEQTDPITYAP